MAAVVARFQSGHLGGVDLLAGRVLLDRVVDGGLEAVLVDHQVGVDDLGRLLGRDLQVVRLGPGLGEVLDAGMLPTDPLRDVLERVERGHHLDLAVGGARGASSENAAQPLSASTPARASARTDGFMTMILSCNENHCQVGRTG